MSVEQIRTPYHFSCVSSDIKPSGVPEGSTVEYVDTKDKFVYYNDMWELKELGD